MMAQVHHLLSKVEQDSPGRSHRAVFRRAIKERFAQFSLQPPNCLAHRRLGAVQCLSRARKAFFLGHRQEDFQLINVHR